MRGDPSAEALSYKQVSRSASEPLPLSLVIVKTPCGQRVIQREAEKKRRSRFAARKAWRGIEGRNRRASGARDLSEPSRSESEAERVWKVASRQTVPRPANAHHGQRRAVAHTAVAEVQQRRAERSAEEPEREGDAAGRSNLPVAVEHLPALVRDMRHAGCQGHQPGHCGGCGLCVLHPKRVL